MAIYRPPKPRWPLATAVAVAGLVIGLLVGLSLGREEFDPRDSAQQFRSILASAAGSLEVAGVEYRESVVDGRVVKQAEFDGSLAAVASSREKFEEVRPALEALSPERLQVIDDLYDEVEGEMRSHADADAVTSLLEQMEEILKGSAGS